MIKTHQKLSIYAIYLRTPLAQQLKNRQSYQRKLNIEVNPPVLIINLLTFNYWPNYMEKLTAAVKIFFLT